MLIDTHAHLNDEFFKDKLDKVISDAYLNGVEKIFTVSYSLKSIDECVKISEKYPNVYAIIGIHPENIDDFNDEVLKKLEELSSHKKVIGIGEIGLEYHFLPDDEKEREVIKQKQKEVFIKQLELAYKVGLPISIHQRDSIGDMLKILKEHKDLLVHGGVVHCFSESEEVFKEIIKLGLKVAFGGVLTFKNGAHAPRVATKYGLENFLIETDCPYLTPEPLRGRCKNEPQYVRYVAEKIASLKICSLKLVEEMTTKNALEIFKKVEL